MRLQDTRDAIARKLVAAQPRLHVRATPSDSLPTSLGNTWEVATLIPDEPYVQYQEAFSKGLALVRYRLEVQVGRGDLAEAHRRLDEMASAGLGATRSVIDALEEGLLDIPEPTNVVVMSFGNVGQAITGPTDSTEGAPIVGTFYLEVHVSRKEA